MSIGHSCRVAAHAGRACISVALMAIGMPAAFAQSVLPATPADQNPQIAARAEVSRTPFELYVFKQNCALGANCAVNFNTVPASNRLELKNVSCYIEMVSEAPDQTRAPLRIPELRYAQLLVVTGGGTIVTASTLAPIPGADDGFWSANHVVSVFAPAGQHFQVLASPRFPENRVSNLACHISGQMVRLQ